MRIRISPAVREQASVLVVTLFIALMLGMFLFYYLHLVRTQNILVARSQAWNASLTMAEAGVEEALAQLNPGAPSPKIDRTANGWGLPSGGFYGPKTRTLSSGSYAVTYTDDTYPVIYSTGYVAVASLGVTLSRTVEITTTNAALFPAPLTARYNINFKGNNITTDSFDPQNPALSTNGRYDPTKTSTNGTIASFAGLVNVGNADVNGAVLLGPNAANTIPKNNGYITGGVSYDFNLDFADVVLPQTGWFLAVPVPQIIDGVVYDYVFNNSGDYQISGLLGSSIYVGTNATVRLLFNSNTTVGSIRVAGSTANTAGNLTIYMNGPSFTLSGSDTVDGGNARNLSYYGTPNNTSIKFSGNSAFTGTIYAPEASFTLGGGGLDTYDFVGAVLCYSVTINGHYNFHYPEDLGLTGPMSGYVAWCWREL